MARRPGILAFVEVKLRAHLDAAAAALSLRQQARIRAAAEIVLGAHPDWHAPSIRFDVMLIDTRGRLRHVIDAFREGLG